MSRRFPNRFFVHFGDSTRKVPEFALAHPNHRCNFIYVDGGHTYSVAMADLINMAAIADVDAGNVIKFDDYPTLKAFPRRGVYGYKTLYRNFRTTCCYLCTIRGGKFKFKLEIAIVKYSGLI